MTEQQFVNLHQTRWHQFKAILKKKSLKSPSDRLALWTYPMEYRKICRDLNQAKALRFSPDLLTMLNHLVVEGHQHIYHRHLETGAQEFRRILSAFPRSLIQNGRLFLACHLLFYGLVGLAFLFGISDPSRLESILGPELCTNIDSMYNPTSDTLMRPEGVTSDADMFGYYINNNISVGFRTFASGIFAGIGSLLLVGFNGVYMGLVMAYIYHHSYNLIFYQFVLGHGSFELTAILIFGMAGFMLGRAILYPGRFTRGQSLTQAGQKVLPMIYGSTVFLFLAACLEAFWSASSASPNLKFGVAAGLWLLVYSYLLIGGLRGRRQ